MVVVQGNDIMVTDSLSHMGKEAFTNSGTIKTDKGEMHWYSKFSTAYTLREIAMVRGYYGL